MSEIDRDRLREAVDYADRWVAYQQLLKEIPGVAVAIRFDGELLLSKGYGFADMERQIVMTPHHIFRIASHSKTFTATAIMQLAEVGRLRLDDRIGRYVPWLDEDSGIGQVTIRQLLNHAGGVVRDGSRSDYWQLEEPFPDGERLRELVDDGGGILAPNESFKYSNIGYSLLGLVIEAAGGMPYHDYVMQHIVRPLGLTDTGPETNEKVRERLVTGYTRRFLDLPRRPVPDVETGAMAAATGFYSSAEDLSRYAAAHALGTGELLTDASKREMQQPYWKVEPDSNHYGLGFAVGDIGDRRFVGHGGGFPGHSTRTWLDPKDRLVVVVLTNETGGPSGTIGTGIIKIINFALKQSAPSAESHDRSERFTGRFVNTWGVSDIVRLGDTLVALSPDLDDPVANATELEIQDDDTLRIAKTNGYGSPGETIRYIRDESGQVTKIIDAGATSYPEAIFRERMQP